MLRASGPRPVSRMSLADVSFVCDRDVAPVYQHFLQSPGCLFFFLSLALCTHPVIYVKTDFLLINIYSGYKTVIVDLGIQTPQVRNFGITISFLVLYQTIWPGKGLCVDYPGKSKPAAGWSCATPSCG